MSPLPFVFAAVVRAAYATPDELQPEGVPHAIDLSLAGRFARVDDRSLGAFEVRERALFGRTLSYATGIDLEIGGMKSGVVYGGALYPIGVGVRFGRGGALSLAGGVGADGAKNAVPFAARFPVELALAASLGPLRPTLWARPSWTTGSDSRTRRELEAGVSVRFGGEHAYWTTTTAGRGPSIGFVYRDRMNVHEYGVQLAIELTGGR